LKEESTKRDIAFGKQQSKVEACSEKLVARLRMVCYQQAIDGASNTVVRSLTKQTRPKDVDKNLEGYYEPLTIAGKSYSWAPDLRRVTHRWDESRFMGILRPDGSLDPCAADPLQEMERSQAVRLERHLAATLDGNGTPGGGMGSQEGFEEIHSRDEIMDYLARTQEFHDAFGPAGRSVEGLPELPDAEHLLEGQGGAWGSSGEEEDEEEEEEEEEAPMDVLVRLQGELHAAADERVRAREERRTEIRRTIASQRRTDEFGIMIPPRMRSPSPEPATAYPTLEAPPEAAEEVGTSGVGKSGDAGAGLNLGRNGKDLWEIVRVRMIRSGEMKKKMMRNDILDCPVGIYARFVPHTGEFQKPPNVRAKTHATKAMEALMRVKDLIDEKKGKVPENQLVVLDAERRFYLKELSAANFYEKGQEAKEMKIERQGEAEDKERMALLDEISGCGVCRDVINPTQWHERIQKELKSDKRVDELVAKLTGDEYKKSVRMASGATEEEGISSKENAPSSTTAGTKKARPMTAGGFDNQSKASKKATQRVLQLLQGKQQAVHASQNAKQNSKPKEQRFDSYEAADYATPERVLLRETAPDGEPSEFMQDMSRSLKVRVKEFAFCAATCSEVEELLIDKWEAKAWNEEMARRQDGWDARRRREAAKKHAARHGINSASKSRPTTANSKAASSRQQGGGSSRGVDPSQDSASFQAFLAEQMQQAKPQAAHASPSQQPSQQPGARPRPLTAVGPKPSATPTKQRPHTATGANKGVNRKRRGSAHSLRSLPEEQPPRMRPYSALTGGSGSDCYSDLEEGSYLYHGEEAYAGDESQPGGHTSVSSRPTTALASRPTTAVGCHGGGQGEMGRRERPTTAILSRGGMSGMGGMGLASPGLADPLPGMDQLRPESSRNTPNQRLRPLTATLEPHLATPQRMVRPLTAQGTPSPAQPVPAQQQQQQQQLQARSALRQGGKRPNTASTVRFEIDEDSEYRPSTAGTRPTSGSGPPSRKVLPSRPGSGVSNAITTVSTESSDHGEEGDMAPGGSTEGHDSTSFQAFLSKQMLKIDTAGGRRKTE